MLLHVSGVGADNDFFNITTLDGPWIESKASVRIHDTDLVKRWFRFPNMCSSDDIYETFRLIN